MLPEVPVYARQATVRNRNSGRWSDCIARRLLSGGLLRLQNLELCLTELNSYRQNRRRSVCYNPRPTVTHPLSMALPHPGYLLVSEY